MTRTIDGRPYFLSLTDTAGQEEYRGLWAASNLRSDAFLLVYDITSAPSLSALDYFMQMIDMECDHRHDSGGIQPVKIVAGNKCDLKDARAITSRQGLEWARSRDCGFMETSAREMVNIEETFARTFPSFPFFENGKQLPIDLAALLHISPTANVDIVVIVRRVVAARRHHASGGQSGPTRSQAHFGNSNAASRTQPLTPLEKSSSDGFPDRPGGQTRRDGFWAKLKCW